MSNKRISEDEYYLRIALAASLRSTCIRAAVGAVIVKNNYIISTGFNGSLPKHEHCDEGKTCCFEGHCIRTTHAELNAIKRAHDQDQSLEGSIMYSTHRPCFACMQAIAAFGIKRVIFDKIYNDPRAYEYAMLVGIELKQLALND